MHEFQPINNPLLLKHLNQSNFQMLQQQPPPLQHPPPSLKCPRCDSINTKFCYYNNYNLSQPRHFCKNCRRYWTKGGVLRNVPVGGGCRKSKRSSSSSSNNKRHKSPSNSSKSVTNAIATVNSVNCQNSHSSSDSSSALFQIIPEVENFAGDLFSGGEIEGFMSLITDNNNNNKSVGNNNGVDKICVANSNNNEIGNVVSTTSFCEYLQSQGIQDWDLGKITGTVDLVNPTDRNEDLNVGLTTLDWNLTVGNENSNNFDDSSTADHHHGYWGQSTVDNHDHDHDDHDCQWSDSTTSHLPLFLP